MDRDDTPAPEAPHYSTVVSPNDHMWLVAPQYYFEIGVSALDCIRRALIAANITPTSILDFPCGHGRVCRMLRSEFPNAHLTACDIERDGVISVPHNSGRSRIYSREDIREVTLPRLYRLDLVWVLVHAPGPQSVAVSSRILRGPPRP